MPAIELFSKPIYNTWIELTYYQNQEAIEKYVENVLENDMPPGVLMIDDTWSNSYGDWRFNTSRFPKPKEMIDSLHKQGFDVMLWICPFVTPDTVVYREVRDRGFLITEKSGEPVLVKWWNGYSAVLDMTNPLTKEWLKKQLDLLQNLGIDGFKFDAGDSFFYKTDYITHLNGDQNSQSQAWSEFGKQYPFNEYRVTFGEGGAPLLQRLCDKFHSWGKNGISSLIPDSLAQGIIGSPFSSPDMIGGGDYLSFENESNNLDGELFVRYAEIACLMPAMQFSAFPKRVLNQEDFAAINRALQTRKHYLPYILQQIKLSASTGEPVIRYMSYEFPDENIETLVDQFMIGSALLVAPIWVKGKTSRKVYLPKGIWYYKGRKYVSQGEEMIVEGEYGSPIVFEK